MFLILKMFKLLIYFDVTKNEADKEYKYSAFHASLLIFMKLVLIYFQQAILISVAGQL